MVKPNHSNLERAAWREKCREQLSQHIQDRLGILVAPSEVRLKPGPQDPYKWDFPPEKNYLFKKQMSKHCMGAYKEICEGINEVIEVLPADASPSEAGYSAITVKSSAEETTRRPLKSFTARIDELTNRNTELEAELEHWKTVASAAERFNCELRADLKAAQSNTNSLQQKNERITQICQQTASAAKFYHAETSRAKEALAGLFAAFESTRARAPVSSKEQ